MNKNIMGYFIGPIGISLLSLISVPIMTWFFSPENIGKISMLQVVSNLFILIFSLGLDQAYVREYHEEKEEKELLFKNSLLPGLLFGSITLLLIYSSNPNLISFWIYGEGSSSLSLITILCFIIALFLRFSSLVVRMQERSFIYSISQILPKASLLLFLIILIWSGLSKDIYNLVILYLLSISIASFYFIWYCKPELIALFSLKLYSDQLKFRAMIIFGLPLVFSNLAIWGVNAVDKFFLRILSDFSELGLYSITFSVVGIVGIFTGVFNTIWTPLVYKWLSQNNNNIDIEKIDDISEYLLAAVFYIVIFFGIISQLLPYFFPLSYNMIQYIVVPCLLGPLFYTLSETTAIGISIVKKNNLFIFISVVTALCNILGNYLLIPKYGAVGASISTAISFWLFYILRTELSKRVWINIDRKKTYYLITLLLVISIVHALKILSDYVMLYIWFILFFLGLAFFRKVLKKALKVLLVLIRPIFN